MISLNASLQIAGRNYFRKVQSYIRSAFKIIANFQCFFIK